MRYMCPVSAAASTALAGLTEYSGRAFGNSPDAFRRARKIMAMSTLTPVELKTQVMRIVSGTANATNRKNDKSL